MQIFHRYTKNEKLILILLIGASICGAYTGLLVNARTVPTDEVSVVETPIAISYPNPFDEVLIEGKAAYVVDVTTGKVLFQKNAQAILPLASITKIMTALVAAENALPSRTVAISEQSLLTEGETGLQQNERWKLQDLIDFMLIESSNDGAAAVADSIAAHGFFDEEMNKLAKRIGLQHSTFSNETGLDLDAQTPGAYGSAEDVAKLFSYIIKNHPTLLEATQYDSMSFTSLDGITHSAKNTNTSIGQIPNLIASKTGYTLLAGGNLAIAFDAGINRPIIITVLGSSQDGRFSDVIELASTTLSYFSIAER